ncbi:MAG: choice-of-anchor J domain-containing protein [Bacteroidales bacterium]|nr:choice-of-anchor J domain-containing protein [Bacteroidales bacterium]
MKKVQTSIAMLFLLNIVVAQNFVESFESANIPPLNWRISQNNEEAMFWELDNEMAHSGEQSLKLTCINSASSDMVEAWLITPLVEVQEGDIFSFQMAYSMNMYTEEKVQVLVSTTGNNENDFSSTALLSLDLDNMQAINDDFYLYSVSLSEYVGQQIYIAIRVEDNGGFNTFYFDDITLPAFVGEYCFPPQNITVRDIDLTSAVVEWEEDNAGEWIVEYTLVSDNTWTESSTITVQNTTSTVLALEPASEYKVRVKAICEDGNSDWTIERKFKTPCEAFAETVLPWSINFEDRDISCWTEIITTTVSGYSGSTVYPSVQSAGTLSQQNYALTLAGGMNLIALPLIDTEINDLRISFYAKNSAWAESNAGVLEVGLIENINEPSSFDVVDIVPYNHDMTFRVVDFSSANLSGNTNRIAFRFTHSSSSVATNYWYVDDIIIDYIPTCVSPVVTSLTIDETTENSVKLFWVDEENQTWKVYYKANNETTWQSVTSTSNQQFEISNLSPATSYSFYIKSVCSENNESLDSTFVKSCSTKSLPVTSFPYVRTFEEDTPITEVETRSNNETNIWTIGQATNSTLDNENNETGHSLYISNNGGTNNEYTPTVMTYAYAIIKVDFSGYEQYKLSFDYKVKGDGGFYSQSDYLSVYLLDENIEIPTASQPIASPILAAKTNVLQWTRFDTVLTNVDNTTKNLVFMWRNDMYLGYNPPAAIDNIAIKGLNCTIVESVSIEDITSEDAVISWNASSQANSWTLYYKSSEEESYNEVQVSALPFAFALSNIVLSPNTDYSFYIKVNCGEEISEPSQIFTFHTPCDYATLPINEGFESYSTTYSRVDMPCWYVSGKSSSYPAVSYGGVEGNNSLNFYGPTNNNILVFPSINTEQTPINTLQVTVWVYSASTNEGLSIGVMPTQTDTAQFEVIETFYPTTTSEWVSHTFNLTDYQGTSTFIALKPQLSGWYNLYIDSITLREIPLCSAPSALSVSNEQTTSVSLSWTPAHQMDNNFVVYYKPTSEEEWQIEEFTTSENYYVLENLLPSTQYEWSILTVCSSEDSSEFAQTSLFTTQCDVVTNLPLIEDFETIENNDIPLCWSVINSYDNRPSVYYSLWTTNHAYSGERMMKFSANALVGASYLVLPQIANDVADLKLSFYGKAENSVQHGKMEVGIMSDPTDVSTFESVMSIEDATTSFNYYETSFASAENAGENMYIVFKYTPNSSLYSWYIDMVKVEEISSCSAPVTNSLKVDSLSFDAARLSWNDENTTHNQWRVYYKEYSQQEYAFVDVQDTVSLLSNLQANTIYSAYVKTLCDNVPSTDSTFAIKFHTYPTPIALPYMTEFSANESLENLSWYLNNDTLTNQWVIGDIEENACLFVSKDMGQTPNYHTSTPATITAEKIFIMPEADSIMISFDYKVGGETIGGVPYDYLKVFFADFNFDYKATAEATLQSFYLYNDNALKFSSDYFVCMTDTVRHYNIRIENPGENLYKKIVFMWRNDSGSGSQPSVIIDNFSIRVITPCDYTHDSTINAYICEGETYNENGFEESLAGEYFVHQTSYQGCDSTIHLVLNVYPTYSTTNYDTIYVDNIPTTYNDTTSQTLSSQYGCDSTVITINTYVPNSSLLQTENEDALSVYPIPANDFVTVKMDNIKSKEQITISDVQGKIILTKNLSEADDTITLNIHNLASGVYYLHLKTSDALYTRKLLIKR